MRYLIIVLIVFISGCASTDRCQSYQCDYKNWEAQKAANPCITYEDNISRNLKCLREVASYNTYIDIPVQYAQPIQAYPNYISLPGGHGMMCNMGYCYGY